MSNAKLIERLTRGANVSQGQLKDQTLLNEAAAALERMEWQDIATAPRDGAQIDLLVRSVDRYFRIPDCKWGKELYGLEQGWLDYTRDPVESFRDSWQFIEAEAVKWKFIATPKGPTP